MLLTLLLLNISTPILTSAHAQMYYFDPEETDPVMREMHENYRAWMKRNQPPRDIAAEERQQQATAQWNQGRSDESFFADPANVNHPDFRKRLLRYLDVYTQMRADQSVETQLSHSHIATGRKDFPDFIGYLLDRGLYQSAAHVLDRSAGARTWPQFSEWIVAIIAGEKDGLAQNGFSTVVDLLHGPTSNPGRYPRVAISEDAASQLRLHPDLTIWLDEALQNSATRSKIGQLFQGHTSDLTARLAFRTLEYAIQNPQFYLLITQQLIGTISRDSGDAAPAKREILARDVLPRIGIKPRYTLSQIAATLDLRIRALSTPGLAGLLPSNFESETAALIREHASLIQIKKYRELFLSDLDNQRARLLLYFCDQPTNAQTLFLAIYGSMNTSKWKAGWGKTFDWFPDVMIQIHDRLIADPVKDAMLIDLLWKHTRVSPIDWNRKTPHDLTKQMLLELASLYGNRTFDAYRVHPLAPATMLKFYHSHIRAAARLPDACSAIFSDPDLI